MAACSTRGNKNAQGYQDYTKTIPFSFDVWYSDMCEMFDPGQQDCTHYSEQTFLSFLPHALAAST